MPSITVKIIDHMERPLPFVPVSVGGIQGATNHAGIARINVPRSGNLQVVVRSANHAPYSQTHSIPPNEINIQLQPARL